MATRNADTVRVTVLGQWQDKVTRGARTAAQEIRARFVSAFNRIRTIGLVAFTALIGIIASAVFSASEFQSQMAQVGTLIDGITQNELRAMGNEVQALRVKYGQLREDATKALFDITSAGFQGAEGIAVLETASRLAVAGVSDVSATSDLITSALNAFSLGASEANRVSDIFFKTQKLGKTTITELASSLPQLFPTAQLTGTTLEELGGAIATLTAAGIATPQAVTTLNAALLALSAPAEGAKKVMEELGIRTKDTQGKFLPLVEILKQLQGLPVDVLSKIIPSVEGIKAVSTLTGDMGKLFDNIKQIEKSSGATEEGFQKISKTASFMGDKAKQAFQVILEKIGAVLNENPTLIAFFSGIVAWLGSVAEWVDKNKAAIDEWIQLIVDKGRSAWNFLAEGIQFAAEKIPILFDNIQVVMDFMADNLPVIRENIETIVQGFIAGIDFIWGGLQKLIGGIVLVAAQFAAVTDQLGISSGTLSADLGRFGEGQLRSGSLRVDRSLSSFNGQTTSTNAGGFDFENPFNFNFQGPGEFSSFEKPSTSVSVGRIVIVDQPDPVATARAVRNELDLLVDSGL